MARVSVKQINEVPLYKKTTELDSAIDDLVVNFDKYSQRKYGDVMSSILLNLIRYCSLAYRDSSRRLTYLRRYEAEYIALDYIIRKLPRKKLITNEQYASLMILQESISKQMTGWIVSVCDNEDE